MGPWVLINAGWYKLNKFTLADSQGRWFHVASSRPPEEPVDCLRFTDEEVAALRPKAHKIMAERYPHDVFVKTHNALIIDRGTEMITLEHTAAAIYIVRNPLDIVISFADHLGYSIDRTIGIIGDDHFESAAEKQWVYQHIGSWSLHVRSWTRSPHPGLHVIRYEDMAAAPLQTFGGAARFLGLNPPRARLERAIEFSSFDVLRGQEEALGFVERGPAQERFFRVGKSGQWPEILSKEQVTRVVRRHKQQMARFGYVPDGF
jgi:hypothetical protein